MRWRCRPKRIEWGDVPSGAGALRGVAVQAQPVGNGWDLSGEGGELVAAGCQPSRCLVEDVGALPQGKWVGVQGPLRRRHRSIYLGNRHRRDRADHGVVEVGAMHGEIGHTQFLPKNVLQYGVGGSMDNAQTALASTANFLKGHGWRAGGGYQPGETNFGAIQAWNAASVYQRAIAVIGKQIDGN